MADQPVPHLHKTGKLTQLFVDGKPFLALGGELGNSTASDLTVLRAAFEKLRRMRLNTVMLPVYWDRIEATEGTFDFSLVQGAIELAREFDLRIVYLWFGTWKNSMSCYAPTWVKRDTVRFERALRNSGQSMEIISPECDAARDADARAFAALMRWTKEFDSRHRTVVMAQVENEVGMIPGACEHSPKAVEAYEGAVPVELTRRLPTGGLGPEVTALWEKAGRKPEGSWADVFGADPQGEEVFTAWRIGRYVEAVAAAGVREYPLPMFTNAALMRPGYVPGQYPSAGPLPHLMEVWQVAAPSLDFISPDIYFPSFMDWSTRYVRSDNALFIPEMAPSTRAAGNALWAIASLNAIGTGPFAIETVDEEKERLIGGCYGLLEGMATHVLDGQAKGAIAGLSPQVGFDWTIAPGPERAELGGIVFEAQFERPSVGGSGDASELPTLGVGRWEAPEGTPLGAAMILQIGGEEFVIAGMGVTVTFTPTDGAGFVGIDSAQEGRYVDDEWHGGRWLNGDETHQGRHIRLPYGDFTAQRVTLYRYG